MTAKLKSLPDRWEWVGGSKKSNNRKAAAQGGALQPHNRYREGPPAPTPALVYRGVGLMLGCNWLSLACDFVTRLLLCMGKHANNN